MSEPLALYIHWPFCRSKCPYCDFNSHVRSHVDEAAWLTALVDDMTYEAAIAQGRTLGSIFFGGGTPSLMPPATVAALIDKAAQLWEFEPGIEITLEANPSSVEAARFADLAVAGVNRVSLGIQSLRDEALAFLGREHSVAESLSALHTAQSQFARVNFDLIYARPEQSLADWHGELSQALSYGTGHLSLYQLTIEPGTRFATLAAQGKLAAISADHGANLFELTRAITASAGLPAYETSNHARIGEESRHNMTYWRYRDYCGIGPGAHGRRGGLATIRHKKPENFLSGLLRNGHGIESEERLSGATRATEALLMGLRLREGVDLNYIANVSQRPVDDLVSANAVALLSEHGLISRNQDRLVVSDAGALLLDTILAEIVMT